MKTTRFFILAAGILLAMAITISCSSDGDDVSLFRENLREEIDILKNEISEVEISVDGSNVSTIVYWVTDDQMNDINTAIHNAEIVCNDKNATIDEIASAQAKLAAAKAMFNYRKQLGSKEE